MKRVGSSDSLGALMSICPPTEEQSRGNSHVYEREFQTMLEGLEEEGCAEGGGGHMGEKKRRLSVDQVKALEKNFELENKLEPERKVKLARELGLQPRQVAVWFQNRRARWKTKQLERDYGLLKANYDSLKLNYDSLQRDNQALVHEIRELKAKLQEENTEQSDLNPSIKEEEEIVMSDSENPLIQQTKPHPESSLLFPLPSDYKSFTHEIFSTTSSNPKEMGSSVEVSLFPDMKDGSSDSDSSAILNEENSHTHHLIMSPPSSSSFKFNCSSSYPPPQLFVKMEEQNFFSGEEACSFFSEDQAPTLPWYYPDQWNLH